MHTDKPWAGDVQAYGRSHVHSHVHSVYCVHREATGNSRWARFQNRRQGRGQSPRGQLRYHEAKHDTKYWASFIHGKYLGTKYTIAWFQGSKVTS